MRKIGISNKTRFWQHYVFSNPTDGYVYDRALDTPWHLLGVNDQFLLHTKYFAPIKSFDFFHTYNSIVVNHKPWVIEVESYLPRYKPMREQRQLYRWANDMLANDYCKKIIFTSESTAKMNRQVLLDSGVDPEKMTVVYRAEKRYKPTNSNSNTSNILFAENGFYRKGGMELLRAMEALKDEDIRLLIISRMEVDWAVFPSEEERTWVRKMIENDPRIQCQGNLSHNKVIEEMQRAHLFVSTTWSDPFNNTTLEAMACETCIIGSNTSSMPEIVEEERNGFLLDIQNLTRTAIGESIAEKIEMLKSDSGLLERMSIASEAIAREKFDINVRNERLKKVYDAI